MLQPVDNNSINNNTIATTKAEDVDLNIDDPLPIDEAEAVIGETPDSLSLKENNDDLRTDTSGPFGLKATTPGNDLVFHYSEGITIWKNTDQLEYSNKILDFKYKLNTNVLVWHISILTYNYHWHFQCYQYGLQYALVNLGLIR